MSARSVIEWVGATPDTAIPPRVRLRVFERDDGRCQCGCYRKVRPGEKWQTDHTQALINGGENRESNLRTVLAEHHQEKTAEDVAEKSYVYSVRKRHYGIRAPSRMPGAKNSPFRKKINGQVIRR